MTWIRPQDQVLAADADGASEGLDIDPRAAVERGHRVADVLEAHQRLGIHGALLAMDDLVGGDGSHGGKMRTFLAK